MDSDMMIGSMKKRSGSKAYSRIALLALLFGTGSWIAITGLWLEMPLLIKRLPEGWRLASHLNVMIQFANIGPLVYWYAHRRRWLTEISAVHLQLIGGMISCLALFLAWDHTWIVFGAERSAVLFIATFGLALVDCTSSVTFLPFMARFDSAYMTPYLVGEGLSGFIPSMVALLQGVGEDRQQCRSSNEIILMQGGVISDDSRNLTYSSSNGSNLVITANLTSNFTASDTGNTARTLIDIEKPKLIDPRFSVEVFFFSLFFTIAISYVAFCALQMMPEARGIAQDHRRQQHQRQRHRRRSSERARRRSSGASGSNALGRKRSSQSGSGVTYRKSINASLTLSQKQFGQSPNLPITDHSLLLQQQQQQMIKSSALSQEEECQLLSTTIRMIDEETSNATAMNNGSRHDDNSHSRGESDEYCIHPSIALRNLNNPKTSDTIKMIPNEAIAASIELDSIPLRIDDFDDDEEITQESDDNGNKLKVKRQLYPGTISMMSEDAEIESGGEANSPDNADRHQMAKQRRMYYYLLALMWFNCFTTFGFFPAIQPYSALPYGVDVLHYVVILSGLAYPAGCFLGMLVENRSPRLMNLLTLAGSGIGAYILICALMSPEPPFVELAADNRVHLSLSSQSATLPPSSPSSSPFSSSSIGGAVMIVAWISFVGVLSYAKTMITLWICDYAGSHGMFWVGMNTQFGAALGAGLNFVLINYSAIYNEC